MGGFEDTEKLNRVPNSKAIPRIQVMCKNMTAAISKSQDQDEAPLGREALFEQVKESTARNRNFFFIWIAFSLYVIVTTTATTDLQLLLPYSTITLPTVGVQLPLLGYFFVTPWLILVLHFNLLQNLDTHAHKLWQWARYYPDCQPPRALLQAYIFDFAMLERGATFEKITRWAVRLLCYALGPITIGIMLWRFTDYQDILITLSHLTAFLISTTIVIKARNRLPQFQPETSPTGWAIFRSRRFALPRFILLLHRALGIPGLLLTAIVLLETMWILELHYNQNAWLLSELPKKMEAFVPRLVVSPNTSLVSLGDNQKLMAELDGEQDFKIWWEKHGIGADLRDRSLQGAVLRGVDMRKSLLSNTYLQGAILTDTQLNGADFTKAQMQGTNFTRSQIQSADFSNAILHGANLSFVQFHETTFRETHLQAANMSGAYLQEADLSTTQLQSANLSNAHLQGTIFPKKYLAGVNFIGANLQGADLSSALLYGANLNHTNLQGAYLSNIQLQGGSLIMSQLQGAYLGGAHLEGVNLFEAQLQGADLKNAHLQGAIIGNTTINQIPDFLGTPLSFHWEANADDSDWIKLLDGVKENTKIKLQRASDRSKLLPPPELQKQLPTLMHWDGDFVKAAKNTALVLCKINVEAVQGALLNWTDPLEIDHLSPDPHQQASILADTLLDEITCHPHIKAICHLAKEHDLKLRNIKSCNR